MIDLLRAFRLHDHPHQDEPRIPLGPYLVAKAFSDQGWPQFLLHAHVGARPRLKVSLNAVGSLGNGTIFNARSFCCAWAMEQRSLLIRYKALSPSL